MIRDEATLRQVAAADPGQSTWLSANAGSGKTRVLTDRVARLLLGGTEPQKILCLTYTKAAASEMQNRLFSRLGAWSMLADEDLRQTLGALGVTGAMDGAVLRSARRLFASAIEAPGGLKIQTIHSFCAALLRRFPIEARVSPDFTEMDEHAADLLRQQIVEEMAGGADREGFDAIAALVSGDDLSGLLGALCRNSDYFGSDISTTDILASFGLAPGADRDSTIAAAFTGEEDALFSAVIPVLEGESKTMVALADTLRGLDTVLRPAQAFEALRAAFLRRDGSDYKPEAKLASVPTKKAQAALGALLEEVQALMERVARVQEMLLALDAAEKTLSLHIFARSFLKRYADRKAALGLLDFDDLITRSAALLSDRSVAAWVLYRLDGGIDHILVDEAQDTSPAQWTVIARLAEDFTSGQSARDRQRTIFVVGDKKQSIYSFQGADLGTFDAMKGHFEGKYRAVQSPFQPLELVHSFRSSAAILDMVDLTFDERAGHGLGGVPKHRAFHADLPGRVDLWAPVEATEQPEERAWFDPVNALPGDHHTVVLAARIAAEIRRMIDSGTQIPQPGGQARPVHEGDFLILVQRRSELFHEIIRACKRAGLSIAGADRLKLAAEIAVRDLAALLNFLATPEDDLALATVLRSPLFGWSEAALYDLAHHRTAGAFLWAALRDRASEFPQTHAILGDLRNRADFLRPYELLERILTRHDGRARLIGRLGHEAEDGIDSLLDQALSFERTQIPSLTGFLIWMETDDIEIKRRLESAAKSIRVMTVHGAKGLEAPIVILPDTARPRDRVRDEILRLGEVAVWKTPAAQSPSVISEAAEDIKRRQREERMRLLYVAMTRAEVWLIVCGAGEMGEGADSWYGLIDDGMGRAGAVDLTDPSGDFPAGRRHSHGAWPEEAAGMAPPEAARPDVAELPDWAREPAPTPPAEAPPLSPAALGGPKALAGEDGLDEAAAMLRGTALHRLLEHLPAWPRGDWPAIAASLLSLPGHAAEASAMAAILSEAEAVLASPDFAPYLGPDTLREVELSAAVAALGHRRLRGVIDCLQVGDGWVRAVDFKSNAVVPATQAEVPAGLLRQMGAYAAMLGAIYPAHRIETAILWTRTGRLMPLDPDIVREALISTAIP